MQLKAPKTKMFSKGKLNSAQRKILNMFLKRLLFSQQNQERAYHKSKKLLTDIVKNLRLITMIEPLNAYLAYRFYWRQCMIFYFVIKTIAVGNYTHMYNSLFNKTLFVQTSVHFFSTFFLKFRILGQSVHCPGYA